MSTPFSPPNYQPFASTINDFRNPASSQKNIQEYATSYAASGMPAVRVPPNSFVDTDIPRPYLSLRTATQLPIANQIRAKFGDVYEDRQLGMVCESCEGGAMVVNIRIGSFAADAKLQVGDIIYAAGPYTVADAAELSAVVFKTPGPLELFFIRENNPVKLQTVIYRH